MARLVGAAGTLLLLLLRKAHRRLDSTHSAPRKDLRRRSMAHVAVARSCRLHTASCKGLQSETAMRRFTRVDETFSSQMCPLLRRWQASFLRALSARLQGLCCGFREDTMSGKERACGCMYVCMYVLVSSKETKELYVVATSNVISSMHVQYVRGFPAHVVSLCHGHPHPPPPPRPCKPVRSARASEPVGLRRNLRRRCVPSSKYD